MQDVLDLFTGGPELWHIPNDGQGWPGGVTDDPGLISGYVAELRA